MAAFSDFGANLIGNHNTYVFEDPASVFGSGSVVELLVQLLGSRPPAIFSVNELEAWPAAQLFLGGVTSWQSLKLIAPASVMHPGETMQLKNIGTLEDGTRQNVTAGACGSIYWASDEHIVTISADGLVTAKAAGDASLLTRNADEVASLEVKVVPPAAGTAGSAALPPSQRP